MNENKTVIDVRTNEEFIGGHVKGSINIPLQKIHIHLDHIHSLPQPILLCCASGNRSGLASNFLKSKGISCENAGSWMDINRTFEN